MRFADLDAVTIDGFGTLLRLRDPVPALAAALRTRGVDRDPDVVAAAFRAEASYYRAHAQSARDEPTLAALRRRCAAVFLAAAKADLDPGEFAPAFVGALVFELVPGAAATIEALAARGLALALVANWEISLREHLRTHGLDRRFASIVISAEVGAAKPAPAPFEVALSELRVDARRALHVGDGADDEQGAAAAGMRFAWAPLAAAFRAWE
ncbi:MAG: HAD hydrolase-like protein [Actinomycetota bacterium]|nr:HAD hydrolase-like protein [Actinomycetota bacterium]